MSSKALKRALLIGIDEYEQFNHLSGCVNDVKEIAPLFDKNADDTPNFACRALLSGQGSVGRKEIISAIDALLKPGADVALFYFAGHGYGQPNDVSLVSADGDHVEPGVPVSVLLGKAQNSKVRQVIIILDCCHSGGGGGNAMLGANVAVLRDGVAVLAAARHDQVAKELNGRGEFSTYLGGALEGGAADVRGKVTLAGIYSYLAECFGAWDQRPTFKANLEDAFELRSTDPLVPDESLRKITSIFESPTATLKLDPLYERENPESIKRKKEAEVKRKRAIYEELTNYRNAKLIDFVGADYLYWAAMKSKSCQLNQHGRHYWHLVNKGLL